MVKKYRYNITYKNKIYRLIWFIIYILFFRYTPYFLFSWRNLILKMMGAKISKNVEIYPSCKIWSPRNLIIDANSGIGPNVNIYNVGKVCIGRNVNISQNVDICTATHDFMSKDFQLYIGDVIIEKNVWVAANAFISYGVTVHQGAIIGACSYVYKDISHNIIVSGNPAIEISKNEDSA